MRIISFERERTSDKENIFQDLTRDVRDARADERRETQELTRDKRRVRRVLKFFTIVVWDNFATNGETSRQHKGAVENYWILLFV